MQKRVQWRLQNEGVVMPNRPWFVIDAYHGYQPKIIFLDEGDDPNVYELIIDDIADEPAFPNNNHIKEVRSPLSAYLTTLTRRKLIGENPY